MVSNVTIPRARGPGAPPITTDRMVTPSRYKGHGSPEGVIQADVGQEYLDIDSGYEWVKTSGAGTKTGWVMEGSVLLEMPARLLEWAMGETYQLSNQTYDEDGLLDTATVRWPDNSSGVYTLTEKNATWLREDAYTITHAMSNMTVTQPARTRNEFGRVIIEPDLTVTES